MSPILGIWASSKAVAAADTGAMFPLQVITVGAAGASSVSFTNIPNTYSHLQVRFISKISAADDVVMRFNGDTANNYRNHILYGDGSSAIAGVPFTNAYSAAALYYTNSSSVFAAGVVDILDYTSTNKNKTMRFLGGWDNNGSGNIDLASALWFKTPEAITSVTLKPVTASFSQYSQFALYAVKGA